MAEFASRHRLDPDWMDMTVTRTAHGHSAKAGSPTMSCIRPTDESKPQLELTLVLPPPKPPPAKPRKHSIHHDAKPPVTNVDQMLTMRDVLTITRRHRATIYRWIAAGLFPAPREYKGHQIGWARSDIEIWQGQRGVDTPCEG
jgi:prophage regulatory protein